MFYILKLVISVTASVLAFDCVLTLQISVLVIRHNALLLVSTSATNTRKATLYNNYLLTKYLMET